MHQDLRESITKGIRMRPSRETDYPASVGILYLSPKHLVLAAAGDAALGPVVSSLRQNGKSCGQIWI